MTGSAVHGPRALALLAAAFAVLGGTSCEGSNPGEPGGGDPGPGPDPSPGADLVLRQVVDGLTRPVHVAAPAGDSRLFVVEQDGRIRIFADGALGADPFLDLAPLVSSGGERGLLSLAFHPEYATNGAFFVNYTNTAGHTRVVRYQVSGDPNVADAGSATVILAIDQPFSNHNGGHLVFGPDGMLYVAVGDGGSGGDPRGNGQNPATLLGAILRLDVDRGAPYAVPTDNPFVGHESFRPEIWLWGLRNPWRIGFDDTGDGDLYVADVGQNAREEVTVVGAADGGANLGWNVVEGSACFATAECIPSDFTLPQLEYGHDEGCSITGGDVYRGAVDEFRGLYFYSDFCSGWLRSFRLDGQAAVEHTEWEVPSVGNVTSFGEDGDGEMYVVAGTAIYRVEGGP